MGQFEIWPARFLDDPRFLGAFSVTSSSAIPSPGSAIMAGTAGVSSSGIEESNQGCSPFSH